MYHDNVDFSKLSAQEFIDKIDLKYYHNQIELIEKKISNIRLGYSEYHGIYSHIQHRVLTGNDALKRIKELESQKEKIKKQMKEYSDFVRDVHFLEGRAERVVGNDALIDLFEKTMRDVLKPFDYEKEQRVETKFNDKYGKKMFKLIKKDHRNVYKEERKITKPLYKALKKYAKKMRLDGGLSAGISMENALKEARIPMDHLFGRVLYDLEKEYKENPSQLGVNEALLERIEKLQKNDEYVDVSTFIVGDSKERIKDLETLRRLPKLPSNLFNIVYNLSSSYKEVYELGKQVEILECVKDAFMNTSVTSSNGYEYLVDIYKEQSKKVRDLLKSVDEKFNNSNITVLIEMHKKLEELHRQYLAANNTLYNLHDKNAPLNEIYEQEKQVDNIKSEMIQILLQYPELNHYDYKIDLEKYKMEEKEKVVQEKKESRKRLFEGNGSESFLKLRDLLRARKKSVTDEKVVEKTSEEIEKKDDIPVREHVGVESIEVPEKNSKMEKIVPSEVGRTTEVEVKENLEIEEDKKLRQNIEIPSQYSGLAVQYYPQYMAFIRSNPDYSNLKYWQYLEQVRPDLKELIEIERKKEERVENVYKKYIKYVASCGGKQNAMSFKDFAKMHYNVESYDIPQGYEERTRSL